jgi:hypothetical protein
MLPVFVYNANGGYRNVGCTLASLEICWDEARQEVGWECEEYAMALV